MKNNMYRGVVTGLIGLCLIAGLSACKAKKEDIKDIKPNPVEKEGYTLIFNDEFEEEDIDTTKWLPQYFPHATDSAAGCSTTYKVKDGVLNLMITEKTPFYSANSPMKVSSIQTFEKNLLHPGAGTTNVTNVVPYESFATQYGYFEMRAKLPSSRGGGHIAWWMIGTQDDAREDGTLSKQTGEIDILENILEYPNVFSPKVHAWTDEGLSEFKEEIGLEGTYDDSYHIYAMEWTPQGIKFYVDGEEIAATSNSPKYRMCMFIGMYTYAEGGWSGNDNGVYPKTFSIDYVRVYHDNNGYPDGETLPATSVSLPEDEAIQYEAKQTTEDIEKTTAADLSKTSVFTSTAVGGDLNNLFDKDYRTDFCSEDSPSLPVDFIFEWDSPQTVDSIRIGSWYATGQAPTYFEILTKTADSDWKSESLSNVTWVSASETPEYVDLPINTSDITGLKLVLKNANLDWKHYVITELQILNSSIETEKAPMDAEVTETQPVEVASTDTEAKKTEAVKEETAKTEAVKENAATKDVKKEETSKTETKKEDTQKTDAKKEETKKDDKAKAEAGEDKDSKEEAAAVEITNLVLNATIGYNDETMSGSGLQSIKEVGTTGAYVSEDNPDMTNQYLQFNWDEEVSFNSVTISSQYCGNATTDGQAPLSWEIYVSANGIDSWKKVGEAKNVAWEAGDALQSQITKVKGAENVMGVRVKITDAKLSWGHYAVYSVEMGNK